MVRSSLLVSLLAATSSVVGWKVDDHPKSAPIVKGAYIFEFEEKAVSNMDIIGPIGTDTTATG